MPDTIIPRDELASIVKRGLLNALIPIFVTGVVGFTAMYFAYPSMVKSVSEMAINVKILSEEVRSLRQDYLVHKRLMEEKTSRLELLSEQQLRDIRDVRDRLIIQETLQKGR